MQELPGPYGGPWTPANIGSLCSPDSALLRRQNLGKNFWAPPDQILDPLVGKPIVSSVDSPTEKISHMLDLILQPYVTESRSFIKDTPDFLCKVIGLRMQPDFWLVGLDVVSLYTNIPHRPGVLAVQETLKNRPKHWKPQTKTILELLQCVLKLNDFTFNGNIIYKSMGQLWEQGSLLPTLTYI